ncbi:MAG TPA: CBS domain-containing protein [Chromatiales bacterium]|nr:CBS domain-containing protein [Chromatiales bacterium]
MRTVQDILKSKGSDVWSIGPDNTIFEAVQIMADKRIGALLVMDEQKPVGIVTERDYARKVALEGRSSREAPVREIMSTRVLCVRPDRSIEDCMALMTDKRARHLPVVDQKAIVGMISIGDLVKAVIAEQRFVIDQLHDYITGSFTPYS